MRAIVRQARDSRQGFHPPRCPHICVRFRLTSQTASANVIVPMQSLTNLHLTNLAASSMCCYMHMCECPRMRFGLPATG